MLLSVVCNVAHQCDTFTSEFQLAKKHTLGDPGNQTTGWNSSLHSDKGWILHHLLRVRGRIFWLLAGIMYKISAFRVR